MSAVASPAVAIGIETVFAPPSSAPVSKTSGAAPAPVTQAAPFPELLGQMVDSETGNQSSPARQAKSGSKAAPALAAHTSRKADEVSHWSAAGVNTDAGVSPMSPDPSSARTQCPLASLAGALSLPIAAGSLSSETGDAGSDCRGSAPGGLDGEAAGTVPDSIGGAGARAAWQGPAEVSASRITAAGQTASAAVPADGKPTAGWKPVTPTQDSRSETQPSQRSAAADSVAAAPEAEQGTTVLQAAPADTSAAQTAGSEGAVTHASLLARFVTRGAAQASGTDRADSGQRGAMGGDVAVQPVVNVRANQGIMAFQARLIAAPAHGQPPAGNGPQEVGDAYGGHHPTVEASGGFRGGRAGFGSIRGRDPNLAVALRPGETAGGFQAEPTAHDLSRFASAFSITGAGAAAAHESTAQQRASLPAPLDVSAPDASFLARLAARSLGQTPETDRGDSDRRGVIDADVTVPPAVDRAEQGITAFEALLSPASVSSGSLAGKRQQEVGDAGVGQPSTDGASGDLRGGRAGFRSIRDQNSDLAVSVRPGEAADALSAPADTPVADTVGSKGAGTDTSLVAPLVARSAGQASAADCEDGGRRGVNGADSPVPAAVDGQAEQGTTSFQTPLDPPPTSGQPLAGSGQQEVGDADGGLRPTVEGSGDLSGGRAGSRSIRNQDPNLAGVIRRGGAAAALPAPADASTADTAGPQGARAATSLLARLVAPSLGQTSATGPEDGGRRGVIGADVTVPPAVEGRAEQGTSALQALLVPAPASGRPLAGKAQQEVGDAEGGQLPTAGTSGGSSGGRAGFRSIRDQGPDLAGAVRVGEAAGGSHAEPSAHETSMFAPVSSSGGAGVAPVREGANRDYAAPLAPADLLAGDAAGPAFATKPEAAAREIQLDLRDADARVNVRLVERAGSVRVDVRTPDSHLAGSLRDDLPALTARLEQTGLRAETWHDAPAAAAARIRMAEPTSSAAFPSSPNQSRREGGGHNPRDGHPQEKRQNQHSPESQTQPKEFSWLYTSLK